MKNNSVKILGLDPGTAITGWGLIEEKKGEPVLKAYGCIETPKTHSDVERLREIARDLRHILKTYQPDEVAVEDLFFFKNLKTAIKVAQARGVLLLIPTENRIPVFEYTPLQIKQALTGYGRAEKKQVQIMVQNILKLKKIPQPDDAADALAVALCRQQSRKIELLNDLG
ncbi:MAG: crossover junction endodeoxyribonuclease RuvC [Candidatus Moranbacteria bacterium]|nr:crossover junction endodeoxyribonuclease RuvC [Candidatus Moranbacteria bacterium]